MMSDYTSSPCDVGVHDACVLNEESCWCLCHRPGDRIVTTSDESLSNFCWEVSGDNPDAGTRPKTKATQTFLKRLYPDMSTMERDAVIVALLHGYDNRLTFNEIEKNVADARLQEALF